MEVNQISDRSWLMSSIIKDWALPLRLEFCPFLIIVIGLPFTDPVDHAFKGILSIWLVLPNLILLPHLPSIITSPSYGYKGNILFFSSK